MRPTTLRYSSLFVALCALTVPLAQADSDDDDVMASISLEALLNIEVTTASRSAESASTAPGTILVIPQALILERGYRHLEDVLRDLPGVDVQGPSEPVYYNRVTVRGIQGNNKFVILQNGIRISSPTGEAVPISYNFPLYAVKQIEIVYGPASALYGADAFTGVINLITHQQGDKPSSFVQLRGGSFGLEYADFYSRSVFGENSSFSAGGHKHMADNENLADRYPALYPGADLIGFDGQIKVPASERQGTLGEYPTRSESLYANLAVGNDFRMGVNYSSFRHSTATGYLEDITDFNQKPWWQTELYNAYVTQHLNISEKISSDVQVSYSRYEVDPGSTFANIYVDFLPAYKYSFGAKSELGQQFYYQPTDSLQLTAGYVWEHFNSIPKSADLPQKYDPDVAPESQDMTYLGTDLPLKIYNLDYSSYGAFVQAKYKAMDNLSLVGGLRYDNSSSYGSTSNPRAGMVYSPSNKVTLKLLYGEAFLAPSPKDAYENYGGFSGQDENGVYQSTFFHVANPDLAPEEIQTLELNGSFRLMDNMNLTATVYQEKADNMIAQVAASPQQPGYIPGGNIAYTQTNANVGSLDAKGLDLGVLWQTQIASGTLKAWINASWLDGELSDGTTTVDLPFSAERKLKGGLTYSIGNWFATPSVNWTSAMSGPETGLNIGQRVDSQSVVNLFGGYNNLLIKGLDLTLRINNLLDEDTYAAGLGPDPQNSFTAVPQEGRSVELSVKYRL